MTDQQRHERSVTFIENEVWRLQGEFHLEHLDFDFCFVQDSRIAEDTRGGYTRDYLAHVIPDFGQHRVKVTIATLRSQSEIRQTLRHELAHVLLEPLHEFVCRMVDRLPAGQRRIVAEEWQARLEQATSDVTRVGRR